VRNSARAPILAVAALIAVAVCIGVAMLLAPSGKQRALAGAPGVDLVYPAGKLIEADDSNAVPGASAYRVRGYGTDAEQAEILGYFDTELTKTGYQQTPATPDNLTRFQKYQPLRQYQNDTFTYRLYLLATPYRLSRNVTITDYRQVLFTELSN
jgi:hypothetical protein